MQRAGQLLGKLKISRDPAHAEVRALAAWRVAAGEKIAGHTRAAALVRNSLIVEVEDAVWQRQLNTLRHFLVRNLIDALGEAIITDIDFRPMPPRRPAHRASTARGGEIAGGRAEIKDAPGQTGTRRGPGRAAIDDPVLDLLYRQSEHNSLNRNTA